ncbi:MAG: hypothetical protein V3T05_12975 [Myxococcota bacterium]
MPVCPEQKTKIVRVKRKCPACPERPRPAPTAHVIIRDRAAPKTCAYGKVITTGHLILVVQRAQVTVASKAARSSSYTDNNGVFVVCLDSSEVLRGEKLTVTVSKPPFVPAEQTVQAEAGNHFEILFRLRAPGLTD